MEACIFISDFCKGYISISGIGFRVWHLGLANKTEEVSAKEKWTM